MSSLGCGDKTFYQYLQKMEDIKKVKTSDGSMIVQYLIQDAVRKTELEEKPSQIVYDIAVSYAGQDIEYARLLVRMFSKADLSVFFAPHHQAMFAGDFLPDELQTIYRYQSRRCVIVLSEHYNRSKYTNWERKAALDRKLEDEDYVILIKLDESELKGWLSGDQYFDAQIMSLEEIANAIITDMTDPNSGQSTA